MIGVEEVEEGTVGLREGEVEMVGGMGGVERGEGGVRGTGGEEG